MSSFPRTKLPAAKFTYNCAHQSHAAHRSPFTPLTIHTTHVWAPVSRTAICMCTSQLDSHAESETNKHAGIQARCHLLSDEKIISVLSSIDSSEVRFISRPTDRSSIDSESPIKPRGE